MKLFPKQYVISEHKIHQVEDTLCSKWHNLFIFIHLEDGDKLISGENFLFFGEAFDFEHPERTNQQVVRSIDFSADKNIIFNQIEKLCGYYIILVKDENGYFLFSDAAAQLECYFSNTSGEIHLAGQPMLLQKLLGEKYWQMHPLATPKVVDTHRNIFHKTIYRRISKLMPNHYYDFSHRKLVRFYPQKPLQYKDTQQNINEIIRILQNTFKSLNYRKPLAQALTSGWDSRVLLACNKENMVSAEFYTIDKVHSYSDIDVRIAKEILHHYDKRLNIFEYDKNADNHFPHEAVYVRYTSEELISEEFYKSNFKDHYVINGNIGEVGRFYYRPLPENLSPGDLIYIVKCEEDDYHLPVFKAWQNDFKPFKKQGYDELDFLYWEHRMSNWGAELKSIYNVYTTVISPFNNRYLLDTLFSTNKKFRDSRFPKYYRIILQKLAPELHDIPINPMESIKKIKISKRLGLYPITKYLRLKFRKLH